MDISTGALIVIALRLAVPLLIFRWNFVGGIAALVVDAIDVILIDVISLGGFGGYYHRLDKVLDTYYLGIECFVAWRWLNPWAKWPAIALFAFRMVGVLLFEATEARIVLFAFPNLFENWWLYCAAAAGRFRTLEPRSRQTVAVPLLILLIPKMGQEYLLHFAEAQPWNWIKENIWSP
jgi:hypothetical protein